MVWSMRKTEQDNVVIDRISVAYAKNEIKPLWPN